MNNQGELALRALVELVIAAEEDHPEEATDSEIVEFAMDGIGDRSDLTDASLDVVRCLGGEKVVLGMLHVYRAVKRLG